MITFDLNDRDPHQNEFADLACGFAPDLPVTIERNRWRSRPMLGVETILPDQAGELQSSAKNNRGPMTWNQINRSPDWRTG